MKIKITHFVLFFFCSIIFIACSDEESIQPDFTLLDQADNITLGAETNSKQTIRFSSTCAWKASIDVNWAVITPSNGEAGETSLSVLVKDANVTGEARNATITLSSEGICKEIPIRQMAMNILNIAQTSFDISAEAQNVSIPYTTNIENCIIKIVSSSSTDMSWIQLCENVTRIILNGEITFLIKQNEERKERSATFVLQGIDSTSNAVLVQSTPITIKQAAAPVGTSTDYSCDKQILVLQKHTEGNGIPLIFMGDGFLDKDVKSGLYQQVMERAMKNFFTEEPIKSLRTYFDVWAVTAVSMNNAFGNQYTTKFGCKLEGGGSTLIEGNHKTVMEYASFIPEIQMNPALFNEATCIVVLNTEDYAGTCYFGFNDGKGYVNLAVGYCPMIYGMEDDMFRRVLCHECIGHGFTKLLDEYSYQDMGRIPEDEIEATRLQQAMGWAANVDFTNNRNEILWSKFLQDERYRKADNYGETLGVYEGACTYWSGAYRPTNESMMRSNMHGFNAPSREAIYKRIMSTAYGSVWAYDYETFVAFDQAHLPTPSEAYTRATYEEATRPFATPVFTNMTVIRK